MKHRFQDRVDAGRQLAAHLLKYAHDPEVVVLALPRGGVPVGFEVARQLGVPLDVFLVRKLGVPNRRELAMGAIATGGVQVLNQRVIDELGITPDIIDDVAAAEKHELDRRENAYRGHSNPLRLRGRKVILVDDGIATGSTIRAAIQAIQKQEPASLVVAVPTAPPSALRELAPQLDDFIALLVPEEFYAVGQSYVDFSQITDAEVTLLLDEARKLTAKLPLHRQKVTSLSP